MRKYFFFLFFLLGYSFVVAQPKLYRPPVLTDGWETDTVASFPLDTTILLELLKEAANAEPFDLRGLVVVKDGKLIIDEYYNSFFWENIHDIRSAGKSVTSILALIAVEKGLLSLDTKILSLFPEYADHRHPSAAKSSITLKNLLTMSSGLDADSDNPSSPGNEGNWLWAKDYVRLILDLPMAFGPGERYVYNSACAMLTGAAIEKVSGKTLEEFAREHLFEPMEFGDFFWQKTPAGRTAAMGNIYLRTRDMAKIGYVLASGGKWKGRQILTPESVKAITTHYLDIANYSAAAGYGFMWYLNEAKIKDKSIPFYFASGNGGNKIFVVPSLNLVVAVGQTAYGYGYGHRRAHKYFEMILESSL